MSFVCKQLIIFLLGKLLQLGRARCGTAVEILENVQIRLHACALVKIFHAAGQLIFVADPTRFIGIIRSFCDSAGRQCFALHRRFGHGIRRAAQRGGKNAQRKNQKNHNQAANAAAVVILIVVARRSISASPAASAVIEQAADNHAFPESAASVMARRSSESTAKSALSAASAASAAAETAAASAAATKATAAEAASAASCTRSSHCLSSCLSFVSVCVYFYLIIRPNKKQATHGIEM